MKSSSTPQIPWQARTEPGSGLLAAGEEHTDETSVSHLRTSPPSSRRGSHVHQYASSLFRHRPRDVVFVVLALVHGIAVILAPSIALIAIGLWWNSNTIAHNFIHCPFFRSRLLNRLFSLYLSSLLGIPQRLWRDRHLAHHRGEKWSLRFSAQLVVESAAVFLVWTALLFNAADFLRTVYLPGYVLGLFLCFLQGHFEHAKGTTSHYGRLYNWLFFNDGYHVEHHSHPGRHWSELPTCRASDAATSRWPAAIRWLELVSLDNLERLVLKSTRLQQFVLSRHERAFCELLPHLPNARRIVIVGGGIFPRTALILLRLFPGAEITIVDASASSIELARPFMNGSVKFVRRLFDGSTLDDVDLVVLPLAFIGNRDALYSHPSARAALIHDWIWRPRGHSKVISWPLLKRLNLVLA